MGCYEYNKNDDSNYHGENDQAGCLPLSIGLLSDGKDTDVNIIMFSSFFQL